MTAVRLRTIACAFMASLLALACATAPAPVPGAVERETLDPRLGFSEAASSSLDRRFARAWTLVQQGRYDEAEARLQDIQRDAPSYRPAILASGVVALRRGDLARAETLVERASSGAPDYYAAAAYGAEVARARGDLPEAYRLYDGLMKFADAPVAARERYEVVRREYFDSLMTAAQGAGSADAAIELLRSALLVYPDSDIARIAYVDRLIEGARYEDARTELSPLLDRGLTDRAEVQEALAEIDAGTGRYQEAIIRLERLAKRFPDRGFQTRIEEVKEAYRRANLPPRYHRAAASTAITRADLAVLTFWHVDAVRFARITDPPIAVDIGDIPARNELVQMLGLRLLVMDPVTRQADPGRMVTGSNFVRMAARLLALRGAPPCAGSPGEGTELQRAAVSLENCGITAEGVDEWTDSPVPGRTAIGVLERLDQILKSGEQAQARQ